MSKAKIITYHFVPNFGAALQVYALQKILNKYVSDVEILDYRPKSISSTYKHINTDSLKSFIASIYSWPTYGTKVNKFSAFQNNYLNLTKKRYDSNSEIKDIEADYIFLGSDQIWNFDITNGYDSIYFGDFQKSKGCKVISYAASLGKGKLSNNEVEVFSESLKKVNFLSVREMEAANLIRNCTDKNIEVVLDPTLLLNMEEWNIVPLQERKEKYVLLYTLADYKETREMAENIAGYKGIKLVEISGKRKNIKNQYPYEAIYDAGPLDFLSLIKNADFVVTDSFHGTAFSIIFNKQFVTIPHKTRGGRITGLLEKLNLTNRLTSTFSKDLCDEEITYTQVKSLLNDEIASSIKFIEEALGVLKNE